MTTPAVTTIRTKEDRDRLVEQYLPLVRHVAARLPVTMPATLSREDFFSCGILGLMHAASTYDPSRGASFKTFAFTAIRGAILDEIRKHDPVPRGRRDRLRQLERAIATLRAQTDRPPTVEELADHLGVSELQLDQDLLALHTCKILSLNETPADDDAANLGSSLSCEATIDPSDGAARNEQKSRLAQAISELPEADRHVVVLYHYEELYLKEIGKILGVTESRVSQILSRATERLRLKMKEES